MKKINSINFGGKMIAVGLGLIVIIPLAVWLITGRFSWFSIIPGGLVLLVFAVIFTIEMIQDNSKIPHYERELREAIPFDSEKQIAVIRSSICTGEKTAGFKDKQTGHFTEVMIIHNDYDKERFMKIYGIDEVKIDY